MTTQKKQDRPNKEKTETTEPTKKSETTTTVPNNKSSKLDTDNSLPDPFAPKEDQTEVSTKECLSAEDIQDTQDMNTMPELISSENDDTPQKTFTSENPTNIPKTFHHQPKTFFTKPKPQCKQHNK